MWVNLNSSFLLKKNVYRKQLCAKYVLRHLNLFKEMLNTNKFNISEISDNAFKTFKENFYFENAFKDLKKKIK